MTTSQQSRLGDAPEEGMKAPVVTISSGQETLFGTGQSIAGVVIGDRDRVAINAQTDSTENGIYNARGGKDWERAFDMNLGEDVLSGQLMSDSNTSAVYSLTVPSGGWQPGINSLSFGLLLSPVGFFWGAITGTLSNQADLQLELDAKSDTGHGHVEADISDLQAYLLDAAGSIAMDGDFHARRNAAWEVIDFSIFAPTAHFHVESDISDLGQYLSDAAGSIANDGLLYARVDGTWAAFSTASGNVGEIVAWPHDDVPDGFLDCNGQSVNAVTFSKLFAIIGYMYGGSGANFNLPDLRGSFIRGTANGSGNDPDRLARTDRGDGATGDLVGTKQGDTLQAHVHDLSGGGTDDDGGPRPPGGNSADTGSLNGAIKSTGGSETRPLNVNMNYIIRYEGGGSGNLPPEIVVQDNGVTLTQAVQGFNFIGFNVTEPLDDQIEIRFGSSLASGQYCPDYAFSFIDITSWQIVGSDASHLFRAGRRVRFIDGATNLFGTVTSSIFSGNTVIVMNMDGVEELTASITEVCLVTSATAWSAISEDPFSGDPIKDACVGVFDTVTYIFCVGNNGKAAISNNGGLNWTLLTTGTTEHLNVCVYDAANETFWGGGDLGVLINTDDGGATVTLDDTSVVALPTTGTARITGFSYDSAADALMILYQHTVTPSWSTASSQDQGATWTTRAALGNAQDPGGMNNLMPDVLVGGATGTTHSAITLNNTGDRFVSSFDDTSFSTGSNMSPSVCGKTFSFDDGDQSVSIQGGFDGAIEGVSQWVGRDDTTMSSRIRDFAYSIPHQRLISVGDDAQIAYLDEANQDGFDNWTLVENGFDPLTDILTVVWDEFNGVYVAFSDNGQICRSSNGLGDPITPTVFTGWTLIAEDPFTGTRINRVIAGSIGGTNYWVIVGPGGTLFTSIDAGITWISRATGTTAEILSIGYSSASETFFAGCANGDYLSSTDGTTWVLDNTTIAALGGTGSDAIYTIQWDGSAGVWHIIFQFAVSTKRSATSPDLITWTMRDTSVNFNEVLRAKNTKSVVDINLYHPNTDDLYEFIGAADTSDALVYGRTDADFMVCCHEEAGTDGNGRNIVVGSQSGKLENLNRSVLTGQTAGVDQVNAIHFSTGSNRWIAVGENGSIKSLDGATFNTSNTWFEVTNPFTNHITDVWYDPTDDIFIAIGQNGEIGRSTDGIS